MKSFRIKFTEKKLTGHAGLVHFGRFIEKLGLKAALEKHLDVKRGSNANYSMADAVIMLAIGAIAGVKHISQLAILRTDRVLRKLFEWEKFPAGSTFGRIFRLFKPRHCQELAEVEDEIRRKVWGKKRRGRVEMDMDSTVKGVFGAQEGAAKGYNPKKPGQKSYHPLFCFIAGTRECLHSWFRTGSAYSANGAKEFVKECLARLPEGIRNIFVRADSAFFDGSLLDLLEEQGLFYLIKVKLKNLEAVLAGQTWTPLRRMPGWETAEFQYQCAGWRKARRFVAVRRLLRIVTEGRLFPEYEYDYFCYVLNEPRSPWQAHKKYGQRATSENWIEWCKNQVAAGSILTQDFRANAAIFQTCVLAYNLMVWMMGLTEGYPLRQEPNTLRFWLIHVPARLLTGGGRLTLQLFQDFWFKERWRQLELALARLDWG